MTSFLPDKSISVSTSHFNSHTKNEHKRNPSGYVLTDPAEITQKFDEFNRQLLYTSEVTGAGTLLKLGKKPKVNRSKNFIEKTKPVLLTQEHRGDKKAYIDRILQYKVERKNRYEGL